MRRIARFETEAQAHKFIKVLQIHGIDSQVDRDDEEGAVQIWVKKEDQIPVAEGLYREFIEKGHHHIDVKEESPASPPPLPKVSPKVSEVPLPPYASPMTRFFIFICTVIFLVALYQGGHMTVIKDAVFPRFLPIQQKMMYDYPVALVYAEELMDQYEVVKGTDVATLPEPGQELIRKIRQNPPWEGLYMVILEWGNRKELLSSAMFSDIRKGEIWRLFTPVILHIDFLHYLFNMLWLWLLGKMVERNMKFFFYLLFIVITAVITNTLQYLMTGPFFMGFSGVVSAMAGYIWVRKKRAPWESYPIDFSTLIFLWVFIFGMLALQVVAFFLEIMHIVSFPLNIANTAHVSGVILGMLFGRLVKRKA